MAKRRGFRTFYVNPEDFRTLRQFSGLSRLQVADELRVTVRTIQNWETGGARIPWMAYRMLRIIRGYALPGKAWEGWEIHQNRLYAPNGRWYDVNLLAQIEQVFGMARLWKRDYLRRNKKHLSVVGTSPHGLSASLHPAAQETREVVQPPLSGKLVLPFVMHTGGQK